MLFPGEAFHQFCGYLIAQGIHHDDHLLGVLAEIGLEEILLTGQRDGIEIVAPLVHTHQPLQIHQVAELGILLVEQVFCLTNLVLNRVFLGHQLVITLQRTSVKQVSLIPLLHVAVHIVLGRFQFQRAHIAHLVIVGGKVFQKSQHQLYAAVLRQFHGQLAHLLRHALRVCEQTLLHDRLENGIAKVLRHVEILCIHTIYPDNLLFPDAGSQFLDGSHKLLAQLTVVATQFHHLVHLLQLHGVRYFVTPVVI